MKAYKTEIYPTKDQIKLIHQTIWYLSLIDSTKLCNSGFSAIIRGGMQTTTSVVTTFSKNSFSFTVMFLSSP